MSRAGEHLRAAAVGVGIAAALVLLLDLAGQLQRGGETAVLGSLRWSVLVLLGAGALAGGLPALTRSGAVVPAVVAAVVLSWPILASRTPLPGPPSWIPLLSSTVLRNATVVVLLVGVLGAVASTRR